MIEELYINGILADIEDVDIVRNYFSPFFSDVTELFNDGTQTVKLPLTATNRAIFEHCDRADFVSDIPYDYLYADYWYDGLQIFKHAEVKILSVDDEYIEVQFVYGIDKSQITGLFGTKLNELTTITGWVVNWNKTDMFYSGDEYDYIDFVSGERTFDTEAISGAIQSPVEAEEPAKSNVKEMTLHPFILFSKILDLIDSEFSTSVASLDFDSRLNNKGIILSGNKNRGTIGLSNYILSSPEYIVSDSVFLNIEHLSAYYKPVSSIDDTVLLVDTKFVKNNELVFDIEVLDTHADTEFSQLDIWIRRNGATIDTINVPVTLNTDNGDGTITSKHELTSRIINVENIDSIIFVLATTGEHTYQINELDIAWTAAENFFGYDPQKGVYDCIANLPEVNGIEFLKNLLIHIGLYIGSDGNGALKTFSLDTFAANIGTDYYDWSGRVSNIRNGKFQFNSNAKSNYIKFANDKDLNADRKMSLTVNDNTIESERDMYVSIFDSPLGAEDEKSELILYEQTVKRSGETGVSFENKYVGDKFNPAIVLNDSGIAKNIPVAEPAYYAVHQKLIERPTVKEMDVNLGLYESATINFEKPVYISELGRYCLLLELQAPNNDVCVAKVLVINQKLS